MKAFLSVFIILVVAAFCFAVPLRPRKLTLEEIEDMLGRDFGLFYRIKFHCAKARAQAMRAHAAIIQETLQGSDEPSVELANLFADIFSTVQHFEKKQGVNGQFQTISRWSQQFICHRDQQEARNQAEAYSHLRSWALREWQLTQQAI